MMENNCEGCIWHDSYTWACCNGDSEYRADFVNCGCEYKEGEHENQCDVRSRGENAGKGA